MVAVEADAAVAPAIETLPAEAAAPAADCEAPATTPAPLAQQPAETPVLEPMEVAPSAPAAAMEDPAPAPAPAPPAEEEVEEEVIVVPPVAPMPPAPATEPPATAAPPVVPVPPVAPVAPARPVAPRAMPAPVVVRPAPCGPTCPPVVVAAPAPAPAPVAMRADAGPCCDRVGECMPIPFAIYGEGDACDVFSFRLGYVVVTLRPAHLVRVERMACGGVRITAPRAGDRLVMVVLDDNQVAYIGRSGSLVLSSDGQVDCFRGLVHLYGRAGLPCLHRERERDLGKDCEPHHGGKPPFGGR
jgi:hypothetical protein